MKYANLTAAIRSTLGNPSVSLTREGYELIPNPEYDRALPVTFIYHPGAITKPMLPLDIPRTFEWEHSREASFLQLLYSTGWKVHAGFNTFGGCRYFDAYPEYTDAWFGEKQ